MIKNKLYRQLIVSILAIANVELFFMNLPANALNYTRTCQAAKNILQQLQNNRQELAEAELNFNSTGNPTPESVKITIHKLELRIQDQLTLVAAACNENVMNIEAKNCSMSRDAMSQLIRFQIQQSPIEKWDYSLQERYWNIYNKVKNTYNDNCG